MSPAGLGLSVRGMTVTFADVNVVSSVDIDLSPGEIVAITGENGAGKSSLGKAIAGVYRPRSGSMNWNGHSISFNNPREALKAGFALIHQEPLTFPDVSIAENLLAGMLPTRFGLVDWTTAYRQAEQILSNLDLALDPRRHAEGLSIAHRQLIELGNGLAHDAKIWIFDETTAPLTPTEVRVLFSRMRRLAEDGCALAIITHHMHEVFEISDRIVVLRDGKKVAERKTSESSPAEIVRLMVGRELDQERFPSTATTEPGLEVKSLTGPGFSDISLTIHRGEIFGLAGLVGAGRTELARALFGLSQVTSGSVDFRGQPFHFLTPQDAMRNGLALVPEDRGREGLVLDHSIEFNTNLPSLSQTSSLGWLRFNGLRETAHQFANRLHLSYRDLDQPVGELSGGNQQKVALSKWMAKNPSVFILDEPTRGVDVGAKHEVHLAIKELSANGACVLLISSDLKELLALSDRIGVLREGRLVSIQSPEEATEATLIAAAAGETLNA